jgi:hypothetical protein
VTGRTEARRRFLLHYWINLPKYEGPSPQQAVGSEVPPPSLQQAPGIEGPSQSPDDGFFDIPDYFLLDWMPKLPGTALKVAVALMRYATDGY